MTHMKLNSPVPRERERQERERWDTAANSVFHHLEQRWRQELKGRKIPKRHRQKMRTDPAFMQLVAQEMRGEGMGGVEYEQRPHIEKHMDGTVTNAMAEELCGDPNELYCPECGCETDNPPNGECSKCKDFKKELR